MGQASTVINCSGDKTAVNNCISSNLANFTTRLDLGAVSGTPFDSTVYQNVVWTTNNVLPGMNISVSDTGSIVGEGLIRAYNMAAYLDGGEWTPASYNPNYSFAGRFDAPPDTAPPSAFTPGDPGDVLLGLWLDGASADRSMLLSFGAAGFDNIGFRVSSIQNANFQLRVQVFGNTSGTGTAITDYTYNFTGAGGQCENLFMTVKFPPEPCNNAPFIGLQNYAGGAYSVRISTDDPGGFYIGMLSAGVNTADDPPPPGPVPEPGTILLSACGLAALVAARRRYQRSA